MYTISKLLILKVALLITRATNPSQFKLELFVNDLSKPGASAFETLGVLDYNQNSNIHYDSDKKVPVLTHT